MTTKTILEILRTYSTDGFQIEIDGEVVEGWEQLGDNVIEVKFTDENRNIYIRPNARMIRDSEFGKMFHYSNFAQMRVETFVAVVNVFVVKSKVDF